MQELLAIIAKGLVDDPDAVSVDRDETNEEGVTVYHIHVAEDDMGRIIGKQQNRQGYPYDRQERVYPHGRKSNG